MTRATACSCVKCTLRHPQKDFESAIQNHNFNLNETTDDTDIMIRSIIILASLFVGSHAESLRTTSSIRELSEPKIAGYEPTTKVMDHVSGRSRQAAFCGSASCP
jgi:hypothetical protein